MILKQAEQFAYRFADQQFSVHTYLHPDEVMGYARHDNEWRNMAKQPSLQREIAKNGITEPLLIGTNGTSHAVIEDGHHRALAAQKLGMDKVPVHILDDPFLDTEDYAENTIGPGLAAFLKERNQ